MSKLTPKEKRMLMSIPGFAKLKKQFDKMVRGSGLKIIKGSGFWDKVSKAIGSVHKFVKDKKVISRVAALGAVVLPFTPYAAAAPPAAAIAGYADSIGYGRKMKKKSIHRPLKMVGGSKANNRVNKIRPGVFNTISSDFSKMKF